MFRALPLVLFVTAYPALAQDDASREDSQDVAAPDAIRSTVTMSGEVSALSQYRFRGVSQSDEDPALQAQLTVSHTSGFYAGAFASTLNGFGEKGGADVELDLYAGHRADLGSGVNLDAGLLYYAFPGSKGGDFEYLEPYASLSGTLGPVTATLGAAYAPDQDALAGDALYLRADADAAIPFTPVTLRAHLGRSSGSETPFTPAADYLDWSLGAEYVLGPATLGLEYVDTDLSGAEARASGATRDIVDAALLASIGLRF